MTLWHDIRTLNALSAALFGSAALMLFGAALWWLAQQPSFTLRTIRIEGVQASDVRHIDPATIRSAALPRMRGNFFSADLDLVRQAFEALPWVRKAMVRREWPNQLIVTLEEHQPLGVWGDAGRILSTHGDVFVANLAEAEEDGELPQFNGPDGSEKEVTQRYAELQRWLAPAGLAADALWLSGRYAWSLRLNNGMTVELGRERDANTLRERIERLVAVYPQLVASLHDRIERVDLRYPNGLALQAKGIAAEFDQRKIVKTR